jgi:hypothetical protein
VRGGWPLDQRFRAMTVRGPPIVVRRATIVAVTRGGSNDTVEGGAWFDVRSARSGERRWRVPAGDASIGRSMRCALRLMDEGVSRVHMEVRRSEYRTEIRDRGSKNGVFLDDERLESGWHELRHGQRIDVGEARLRFHSPDGFVDAALDGEGTHTRTLERARVDAYPLPSLRWPFVFACALMGLTWWLWT